MKMRLFLTILFVSVFGSDHVINAAEDPTLYEYYGGDGVHSGLIAANEQHFTLNSKPFIVYGGSFHYFRVPSQHWRSHLERFRAAGLNTIDTYIPWNFHEDVPGQFNFGRLMYNLSGFLEEVKRADMFAVVRPGPFICAEWEFGGFPSWLLRDPHLKIRTNYAPYMELVKRFYNQVLSIVNQHQFTTNGSVIALQIENEYFGAPIEHNLEYIRALHDIVRASGYSGLIFNSDSGGAAAWNPIAPIKLPDLLETANTNTDTYKILMDLRKHQPGKPGFITEFWPGASDMWGNKHRTYSVEAFEHEVSETLFRANGSINFYMFIGGTTFGFMNGQNIITSYDFDAPLTEAGNYTAKYHKTRELYAKLVQTGRLPKTHLPPIPPAPTAHAYGRLDVQEMLSLEDILGQVTRFDNVKKAVPMELLNLTETYGQRYGYVMYRVETHNLTVKDYQVSGPIQDKGLFMVDHQKITVIEDGRRTFNHTFTAPLPSTASHKLDMFVENSGRKNVDILNVDLERKGIHSDILINGHPWTNLTIYSLDFNRTWIDHIDQHAHWVNFSMPAQTGPGMYRTILSIPQGQKPQNTYLHLPGWTKGVVFVNGFNVGRYLRSGPQRTLFIPDIVLGKESRNIIDIFELQMPGNSIEFLDHPILE